MEKLKKLNQLDVSFFLQLSQVKNLQSIEKEDDRAYKLPKDLDTSILFTNHEIKRLEARDYELQQETRMVEKL